MQPCGKKSMDNLNRDHIRHERLCSSCQTQLEEKKKKKIRKKQNNKNPSWPPISATTALTSCPRSPVFSVLQDLNTWWEAGPKFWNKVFGFSSVLEQETGNYVTDSLKLNNFSWQCKMNNAICNKVLVLFIRILSVTLCCSCNFHVECAYHFELIRARVHRWSGKMRFGRTCVSAEDQESDDVKYSITALTGYSC